jgi:hypothetical protein
MLKKILKNRKIRNIILKTNPSYAILTLQITMLFIVFNLLTNGQASDSNSILSVKGVKEIAPKIKASERKLLNIKIESEAWIERKTNISDPCESWLRTPIYLSSTAWLDGSPDSKMRVDVHKQVLEWINGAAPYSETSYSESFDGKYGRFVTHSSGYNGQTFPAKRGRILPNSPEGLKNGWTRRFIGIYFTSNFYFSGRGFTFSDIFDWIDDPNTTVPACFEFSREAFEGVKCIKITTKGVKNWQTNWWLDPARGFALIGLKEVAIDENGIEHLKEYIKVDKLKEVTDGIWWPMEASMISPTISATKGVEKTWDRFVWRASSVVANDPNFNESIFTAPFPKGYSVDDEVASRKYRVGEDPNAPKEQPKK